MNYNISFHFCAQKLQKVLYTGTPLQKSPQRLASASGASVTALRQRAAAAAELSAARKNEDANTTNAHENAWGP